MKPLGCFISRRLISKPWASAIALPWETPPAAAVIRAVLEILPPGLLIRRMPARRGAEPPSDPAAAIRPVAPDRVPMLRVDHYPAEQKLEWIVSGTSMRPTLRNGDVVQVTPTPFDSLRAGDVVLMESTNPPRFIVHRLVGWQCFGGGNQGVLKGDGCSKTDGFFLLPENYRGRVSLRQRVPARGKTGGGTIVARSYSSAVLSLLNLNTAGLRRRLKKRLLAVSASLSVPDRPGRFLLRKTRCYIFKEGPNARRAWLTLWGRTVAEVRLVDGRVVRAGGVSVFKLLFSPERVSEYFRRQYPDEFSAGCREAGS